PAAAAPAAAGSGDPRRAQEEFGTFVERIQAYMQKAVHEAKVHSSWINPNPAYDDAIKQFVSRVLNVKNRRFLDDMPALQPRPLELAQELTQTKEDGRIKLYVTRQALHYLRDHPGLFAIGEYQPANAAGARQENVAGFVRRLADHCAVAVVPRLLTRLIAQPGDLPLGREVWQDTVVLLPGLGGNRRLRNIFTGEVVTASEREGQGVLPLAEVFANFPVAVL